jgi:hypothetical protein
VELRKGKYHKLCIEPSLIDKADEGENKLMSLHGMGERTGMSYWKMSTANIAEWRFDKPLDQGGLVTLVNRSDVDRRLVAKYHAFTPAPSMYGGGSPDGWDILYDNESGTKMKIAPEVKAPHFKMVPENQELKDKWPFGWAWRLCDTGIAQERND